MRRDIWLASLVGVIIGSWLTLIAVQIEEHGFGLPNRAETKAGAESHATAPTETAKANNIPATSTPAQVPADTAKQEATPAAETKPDDKTSAPPAAVAEQATPALTTAPSTTASGTIDNGSQSPPATLSQAASASPLAVAPTSTPEDTARTLLAASGDQIDKGNVDAAAQQQKTTPAQPETQPAQAAPAKTNTTQTPKTEPDKATPPSDQANAGRGPADQADREQAAAAHRTVPSEPPSQQASPGTDQKPDDQVKPVELVRPFSDRAGILTIAGKNVQLPGIIPTDVDRMCAGPSGKSWPCGAAARTAFRMYLRGRTIDCDLPSPTWKGTVIGACRYVRIDLSEWLVRFGWAEPEPGSPLAALAEQAKQQKRGIYGDDPRAGGKSTLAPALPKENPLNPI